jgi:hypothetical protein
LKADVMPIYIGQGANPKAIYKGGSSLGKVYVGMDLVWEKWQLLFEFDTDSSDVDVFAPTLALLGMPFQTEILWEYGDGTREVGYSVSHIYPDGSVKRVKVYKKPDAVNDFVAFVASDTDIVGVLDLSIFDVFSDLYGMIGGSYILLNNNPELTSVVFSETISGKILMLNISSCALEGSLDLSMFTAWGENSVLSISQNSDLTTIVFSLIISGPPAAVDLSENNIQGTLDLSMFENFSTIETNILLNNNQALEHVTFASSVSGKISKLNISECDIQGTLDLSMFDDFVIDTDFEILLGSNYNLQGVSFAGSISGSLGLLDISSCNIQGALDISMFTVFNYSGTGSGARILLQGNTGLTSISMPTAAGRLESFQAWGCTSLGFVDFSGLSGVTDHDSCSISLAGNGMTVSNVNHILVDLDAISATGMWTNRIINLVGNAAPDNSSGGYNGTAAKASLIAKGFSVYTN